MALLRITVLLILLAKPLYHSPQRPEILDCDELITLGDKYGMKAVEDLINPLKLLYLDTSYAGHIIDWEFRQGFLKGYPDSIEYYMLSIPVYTLDIASNTTNRHAVSNLFRYYCSVPKITKSDTVFRLYDQLYKILPVFSRSNPYQKIMEVKLKTDFYVWSRIAVNCPPTKYADPSVEFDRFLNLKPVNNHTDPRYITLLLGLTLQQLKSPGFTEEKIKELRGIQTCLANKRFLLPVYKWEYFPYAEPVDKSIFPTIRQYQNITELVNDKEAMWLIISSLLARCNLSRHLPYSQSKFLVKRPNKAYFEIYYDFGMQAFRLTLLGRSSVLIEKTKDVID